MPPKKQIGNQLFVETAKSVQKQTKLFSKQVVEMPNKLVKTKSKQFSQTSTDKSENHTALWEYGNGITPNKLIISSWNVNGVRAVINRNDIQSYIEKVKPDIFCLNQTKIDYEVFKKNPIQFQGYHGYWNFCKCSAGYSGVAIFSKYLPMTATQDLPQKQHSQQGRVITLQFQHFYLISAYIPNAGQNLIRLKYRTQQFDKSFHAYCNQLKKTKTVIISGDLNVCHNEIDIANPKGNEQTAGFTKQQRDSFSKFLQTGWTDTFRSLYPQTVKYSWWSMRTGGRSKNIGWRLDYFLINNESMSIIKDSTINNDIFGSDHCPIQLILELK